MKAFYLLFLVVFHVNIPLSAMKPSHNNDTYCWDNNEECWLKKAQDAFDTTQGIQKVDQQESAAPTMQPTPESTDDNPLIDETGVNEDDPGTWFQECPAQGQPFTCNYFKKRNYWEKAISLPQYQKCSFLRKIFDANYLHSRCPLAGWTCAGANPDTTNAWGFNVIGFPVNYDDRAVAQILIDHGADVNCTISLGRRLLFFARTKKMAKLLVKAGAHIDVTCPVCSGGTPLHHLIEERPSDLVDFYLRKGVPVNAKDNNNKTILHNLAYHENIKVFDAILSDSEADNLKNIIRSLLKAGIDFDAKNNEGYTAQDLVRECKSDRQPCQIIYDMIEQERKERAELTTKG